MALVMENTNQHCLIGASDPRDKVLRIVPLSELVKRQNDMVYATGTKEELEAMHWAD
jgi:hypothetical protein